MEKNKMLIDATHPEETRVVVLKGGRVEEFDYESAARKLLRGNIYLAKVTRVEPSLQAAFVEYGGNRHGFLAFSEIHPDYYQIPFADRQALLDEEAEEEARAEREADARAERRSRPSSRAARNGHDDEAVHGSSPEQHAADDRGEVVDEPSPPDPEGKHAATDDPAASEERRWQPGGDEPRPAVAEVAEPPVLPPIEAAHAAAHEFEVPPPSAPDPHVDATADAPKPRGLVEDEGLVEIDENGNGSASPPEAIEPVGSEDALEEVPERPRRRARQYKIQEVIKRRQIILVQVVKEERGSKGAALTTYLSLAGRYTVLMPNTARGGGISRKITNPQDRKRLKAIASELEVPEGMGLIIRTAGAARTKQEIRRDFEYLLRLWESVREVTLGSTAPCLVYEEGDLIKRSLRDLYTKDIDQVLVAGEDAYREAHAFMGMLMPSSADSVVHYREPEPLFARYQIERQLNAMFSPYVTLRSGGYLVINQTEALVSIDINSGKSTREFSIEETALSTNLEAADEIARQLKLRDLAGLIVIDFIDMEEKRNNRAVERRLKDALRHDRARIQIGHISHFGLLEMSRQRLRTGVLEGSTSQCPHCQGTGIIRSTESVALAVLRGIEDHLMKGPVTSIAVLTTPTVALYILNHKRAFISEIEHRYGIGVIIQASDRMQGAAFAIERTSEPTPAPDRSSRAERGAVSMEWGFDGTDEEDGDDEEETGEVREARRESSEETGSESRSRSRRRRRGRGRRDDRPREDGSRDPQHAERGPLAAEQHDERAPIYEHRRPIDAAADYSEAASAPASEHDEDDRDGAESDAPGEVGQKSSRRRRRGRRGGRTRGRDERFAGVAAGSPADPAAEQPVIDPDQLPPGRWSQSMEPVRRAERPSEGAPSPADGTPAPRSEPGAVREPLSEFERARDYPAAPADAPAPAVAGAASDEPREPVARPMIVADIPEPVTAAVVSPPQPVEAAEAVAPVGSHHRPMPDEHARHAVAPDPTPSTPPPPPAIPEPQEPPRRGWWQRRFGP